MKISAKSRCGTRILIDLAGNIDQGPVQVGEISKRQNISVKYLEQLIRPLKKAELITSVRGAKGGHLLTKHPEQISLGQIIRLFEEQKDTDGCFCHQEKCTMTNYCLLNLAWQRAIEAFYEILDSTSIADLEKECCK